MSNPRKNGGKNNSAGKKTTTNSARTTSTGASSTGTLARTPGTTRTSTMEAKPTQGEVTRQAIAEAAYYLYLKRGGNEVVNWLEAEAALKSASGKR